MESPLRTLSCNQEHRVTRDDMEVNELGNNHSFIMSSSSEKISIPIPQRSLVQITHSSFAIPCLMTSYTSRSLMNLPVIRKGRYRWQGLKVREHCVTLLHAAEPREPVPAPAVQIPQCGQSYPHKVVGSSDPAQMNCVKVTNFPSLYSISVYLLGAKRFLGKHRRTD